MKNLVVLCVVLASAAVQAKPGNRLYCYNQEQAAKISISEMPSGEVYYEVRACSATEDPICRIYGDYFRVGKIDLSDPSNTSRVFRDGPIRFFHLFGYSVYSDSEAGVSINFDDDSCLLK